MTAIKTVFITGAAQGLGAALASAFFAEGANVALTDVSGQVAETARQLDPSGARTWAHTFDVRDRTAFQRAFDACVARFGRVDVLINNAARTVHCSVWDIEPEEWDDVLAVNLRGVFFGCQIAGRHMMRHRAGRIINVSSNSGQSGSTFSGTHYSASKAGIFAVTRNFAATLAEHGVTVNAIAPGGTRTPQMDALPESMVQEFAKRIPVGRIASAKEVAAAAVFLASDAASYITGTTLDVNGGLYMR